MSTHTTTISVLARRGITRRNVIGGMAAGLAATAIPSAAFAGLRDTTALKNTGVARKVGTEPTLAKFLCEETHLKIASNLDRIIADPTIDGERTSLALMEARCPGCGERVEPATSRMSAVIPQWKQHNLGPQKYGVSA